MKWLSWISGTTWHTAGLFWSLRPNDTEIELLTHTRKVITGLQEVSTVQVINIYKCMKNIFDKN